jgi:hypothetical protein
MELRARHHGGQGRPPPRLSANRQHHERRAHVSKTGLSVEGRAHVAKGARACRRFHCTHRTRSIGGRARRGQFEHRERGRSYGPRSVRKRSGRRKRGGGTRRGTRPPALLRPVRAGSRIPEARTITEGHVSPDLLPMLASTALLAGLGLLMVKLAVGKHALEWKRYRCPRCGRVEQRCRCRAE